MGWQDRDYYRGGGAGDYLSNPAAILGLSVPFGTWVGVRVRLHFWLLVSAAICLASVFDGVSIVVAGLYLLLLLVALMLHDFGHRLFAQWAGGQLDEFMLWPAGGLIFPSMPSGARPMFIGHIGGIVVNALLAAGGIGLLWVHGYRYFPNLNPLAALGTPMIPMGPMESLFIAALFIFARINSMLVMVNLLPYYWFDGGYLLQSILWPFLGGNSALNVTCIIGMILAVPMFVLALASGSLLGMVMWVLLFSSSYNARNTMQVTEDYSSSEGVPRHRWKSNRNANKEIARRRREEAKIDAILAKVSAQGMHSLTWWEKRTLRKGSQRKT